MRRNQIQKIIQKKKKKKKVKLRTKFDCDRELKLNKKLLSFYQKKKSSKNKKTLNKIKAALRNFFLLL
jgi:hypothetical protein